DWGGPIAMGWATRNPEKVAGAVVLNTWAFVREPEIRLPFLFRLLVLGRGGWRRSTRSNLFVEQLLKRSSRLDDDRLAPYRAPFPTPDDRVGIARFPQLIPQTRDQAHESWATMAGIEDRLVHLRDKPALIVWARHDPIFRRKILERWQHAFTQVDGPHLLDGANHFLQEDAPGPILDHIERWAAALP
ncbi:MAG TPA: alpha/beta fold hydrolase, partial [Myxococcales bacterium]|nr:alpha/beta fold hydrolase [Myxococcales bacterium]